MKIEITYNQGMSKDFMTKLYFELDLEKLVELQMINISKQVNVSQSKNE